MKRITLIAIICLAAFLRLWQLGSVPPSPDWDETALGYNAYSILKTGRDEYGTPFPLSLRSFDDYKPPLYMYLTVPSVALFGLETWAVRLPSAIMGILAVLGTFILVFELTKSKQIALLASFLLAISPWHIQFSRIAFEANIGVTINIWAIAMFLRGLKNKYSLWASAFLFGLGLYAYHSERIFLPIMVLGLLLMYKKRDVFAFILIGLITVAPLVPVFLNNSTLTRLRGTSSLADQTGLLARSVSKLSDDITRGDVIGMVLENRRVVWARTLFSGYISHFSLKWLFLAGDNARHHAPDMGLLYLFELPFMLWGMYVVSKRGGTVAKLLWLWFFAAPIAASPTTELPHAIRTLVFLPVFQIFTAFGISGALAKKSRLVLFFIPFILFNIFYYFHMYFAHTNIEYSKYWQYGYKEAVIYAEFVKGNYKKIVVSTALEQPHMFFLYYLKYEPVKYLAEGGTSSGGFAEVRNRFDVYEFRPIHWDEENHDGSTLYIGTPLEIAHPIQTITHLDGTPAILIGDK